METIRIPGFPTEVSDQIEAPDIAELLMYPIFKVAQAETVMKYGTDFQKMLLSKAPIRNHRKHVTVYSAVHILDNNKRAITSHNALKSHGEWHIDGSQEDPYDYMDPAKHETIHLYQSHSRLLTEFNATPIELSFPKLPNRTSLNEFINTRCKLKPIQSELNKFHTFDIHVHRPVPPDKVEFRFIYRIRETDRTDIPTVENQINKVNKSINIHDEQKYTEITRNSDSVTIHFPESMRGKIYDFQR